MSVNVTCACGAAYNLKDEYAGSRLGCPKCGAAIAAPALPPAPPVHAQAGGPAFAQDSNIQLFTASYTVTGADGGRLALIYKKRLRNIFRKRWYGLGPDGPLFTAQEDSIILSALRRMVLGFLGLLHTDFMVYSPGGQVLGEFNRRMTLRDRYVLDMTQDSLRSLDRRVALALGVMLDTGENR